MAKKRPVYKIIFHNQGSVYELHARKVVTGSMYAFVEVAEIIFGERSRLVVDPSEERLKAEFGGVTRTYIPLHAVIRIDEVAREGVNKIHPASGEGAQAGNVAAFPAPPAPPFKE